MKKLKLQIMLVMISVAKVFLGFIYFFMKLLPIDNKVVMLSRQHNKKSIDFELIEKEIKNRNANIKIEILCNTLEHNIIAIIKYCFFIIKCMYHIATSKVCIIDGYSIPISILKHRKNLKIIQIWHASGAIKKFGYQVLDKKEGSDSKIAKSMKMHRNYNYVMSPSEKTAEFYKEAFKVDENKIFMCGLPRLDYILGNIESDKKQKQFYEEYPNYKEKPTILYVPTFRKTVENTKVLENIINQIDFSRYNLIIKLHQLDNVQNIDEYIVDNKYNTFDLLRIADYIITDYSAVAFESSILEKPIYFYVYDIEQYEEARGLNVDLFKEMESSTSKDINEIIDKIENAQYNFEELRNFKNKFMGEDCSKNTIKLVDFILNNLNSKEVENEENKEYANESSKEKSNV